MRIAEPCIIFPDLCITCLLLLTWLGLLWCEIFEDIRILFVLWSISRGVRTRLSEMKALNELILLAKILSSMSVHIFIINN